MLECWGHWRGFTGVLRTGDIGLFFVRKYGNRSSILRIADIGCIFAECVYFCKIIDRSHARKIGKLFQSKF